MSPPRRSSRAQRLPEVRLLDADPELGRCLDQESFEQAKSLVAAPAIRLSRGIWDPTDLVDQQPVGYLGLLIISGFLSRDVSTGGSIATELLGPGDLLRPYGTKRLASAVSETVDWTVIDESRLAVLERGFAASVVGWPPLVSALIDRATTRAQTLAFNLALGRVIGLDSRLLGLLWQLADRYGQVSPEGVVVPLRLTHELLGRVIGAKRPSVTSATRRLQKEGLLSRRGRGSWILLGDPLKHL